MRKFLLSILLILWPLSGGGQICPDGTWPLPWGVTRDGETAELRQIVCQDKNGKISFQPQRVDNIRIADQYASIQAAIDSLPVGGGVVFIPAGTYITGTIVLPVLPKVVNLFGAGVASTILQANAANIPVIKGGATPTESRGNSLSGFSVKAHASGSTGPAIEMAGFRSATFGDIGYLSNGAGNFNSLFHFASHIDGAGSHCYGNLVRHLVVDSQTGPTTVLLFDNDGTADPNYQANQNEIQDIWVNANTGITTVVDARRSAQTKISGGVIEGNAGAVVLIPGTLTTFENVWMESNAAVPVVPATGADGTSNGVKFRDNYIGAGFTLTLNASYSDWEISGNYPAGNLTVVDSGNFIFFQQGSLFSGRYFFKARSATDFAVRFIPFDDTSPTSYVLSGTNAAQSVTTWGITQNGIFRSFVATGSAPLTVASTTNVTNLNADLLDGVHYFTGSASLSWAAIAANTCVDNGTTITVTGAADGDVVLTGVVNAMGSTANVEFSAYTSAANTVKVRACNVATAASGAISAATVKVGVFH